MTSEPVQRSQAELKNMPSDAIVAALRNGELVDLLAGNDPGTAPPEPPAEPEPPTNIDQGARGGAPHGQLKDEDLRHMSSSEINQARREGRLDTLLGR